MKQADTEEIGRLCKLAEMVIPRLEKLPPDLRLAHHAGGLRRTLLRLCGKSSLSREDSQVLHSSLVRSFHLLSQAARQKIG